MVFGFTKTTVAPVGYSFPQTAPVSSGVTTTVPVKRTTLRQKLATRRALKNTTVVPVQTQTVAYTQPFGTTRRQFFGKKKTVVGTQVYRPTLFQRVKFFIMSKIRMLTHRPMITAAPTAPVVSKTKFYY